MQLSKLIAKIASVIYLSASMGAFMSGDYYRKIAYDLFSNAGLTYMAGFLAVIIGFLIVNYHNRWVKNWTVLITVMGWLALLKGIVLIVCPLYIHSLSDSILKGWGVNIFPYTALFLGLLFGYFGFVSQADRTDP